MLPAFGSSGYLFRPCFGGVLSMGLYAEMVNDRYIRMPDQGPYQGLIFPKGSRYPIAEYIPKTIITVPSIEILYRPCFGTQGLSKNQEP